MIRACFNGEKTGPNTGIRMNAISWYKTAHNLNIVKRYLQTKPGQFVKRTRTICPPALYFHRTVWLLCTPTRGTDLKFFNIKIMKFCSRVLEIFVYSPVKVKCRRTDCPRTVCPPGHSLLQVQFGKCVQRKILIAFLRRTELATAMCDISACSPMVKLHFWY